MTLLKKLLHKFMDNYLLLECESLALTLILFLSFPFLGSVLRFFVHINKKMIMEGTSYTIVP